MLKFAEMFKILLSVGRHFNKAKAQEVSGIEEL